MGSAPSKGQGKGAKSGANVMGQRSSSVAPSSSADRRLTVTSQAKSTSGRFDALWDTLDEANTLTLKMTKHSGFSQNKISLPVLKPITIAWSEEEAAMSGEGLGLRQITFDGEKFVAVRNGWTSGALRPRGNATFKFASEGDIKLASIGIRSTPLSITVTKREDFIITVTDDGFKPSNVYVSEGAMIQFKWSACQISHSVWAIAYCPEHGGFTSLDPTGGKSRYKIATKDGSYSQLFTASGTYFFSTEARDFGTTHTCVVCVRPYDREHVIRIFDTHYDPALLEIEQGDRVWWQWDPKTCKRVHCVFEVEIGDPDADQAEPNMDAGEDDENKEDEDVVAKMKFTAKSGGFRWYGPSKCGQFCHVFDEPGVYYYSDVNFDEMASYIGTIVVRPKFRSSHYVEIAGGKFKTDNLRLNQNDQMWFLWDPLALKKEAVAVMEFERCLTAFGIPGSESASTEAVFWRSSNTGEDEYSCKIKCHRPTGSALRTLLLSSAFAFDLPLAGVYHFRLPGTVTKAFSVICNRTQQLRSVRVMKTTFKPKMLMISKGDVVCWTWREAGQHVIYQVSNTGDRLPPNKGGFWSGPKRGLDSAFLFQFEKPGVYYYSSEAVSEETVGAIVVLDVPDVIEIPPPTQELMLGGMPVVAHQNDVICWSFVTPVTDDLELRQYINGAWGLPPSFVNASHANPEPQPEHHKEHRKDSKIKENKEHIRDAATQMKRRCLNRPLTSVGVFTYASRAFQNPAKPDEPGLVTVIVDPSLPCPSVCYLSAMNGFVPAKMTLRVGDSLVFDWRRNDNSPVSEPSTEAHNVFLVSNLDSSTPLTAVTSTKHFMHSGQAVADSTFLTTFFTPGTYTFASQGAPGMSCVVSVSPKALILRPPQFLSTDMEQAIFDQGKAILLRSVDGEDIDIYYSVDGSLPHPGSPKTFRYSPKRGVVLRDPGFLIVRAVAVHNECIWSEVATSRTWIVLGSPDLTRMSPPPSPEPVEDDVDRVLLERDAQRWRGISLRLRGYPSTQHGCGEVIWKVSGTRHQTDNGIIEHFLVMINDVCYSAPLSPNTRGVTVVGLVGGKTYTMYVEAHATGGRFLPIKSNSIVLNLPLMLSTTGGPLMGVEFNVFSDIHNNMNTNLALSWPVIEANRSDLLISAYQIFVNGRNVAAVNVEQAPLLPLVIIATF